VKVVPRLHEEALEMALRAVLEQPSSRASFLV